MIPRSVKAWLFIYGLFLGSVMGGVFGMFVWTSDIAFFCLLGLVVGSLVFICILEWRKGDQLKKWLPTEHENIGLIDLLNKILRRLRQ